MYTISIIGNPEDWRFKTLVYQDKNLELKIPIEARDGSQTIYLVSRDTKIWISNFTNSLSPVEADLIIARIMDWGSKNNIQFIFAFGETKEEAIVRYKSLGWTVTSNADGSFTCFPPKN